jgi:DNA invertase Pin-like site-specific DNA recombinase
MCGGIMRYIVFSRVSTDQQLDDSQLFMCREYINSVKKEGDEVIEFNEPPTSTRLEMEERPVLMAMLDFLKRGDMLVVFCLTRIARTGSEIVRIFEEQVTKKKALLYSISQPKVDKNFIHIYAMIGEINRDTISANTKSGLLSKQSKMEKVGACWYGYTTDPEKLQLARKDCHSFGKPYLLIPEDKEAQQVSLMVQYSQAGLTYGQIANELETKGFRNRKGNPVHKSTVWRVLKRLGKQHQAPKAGSSDLSH